MLSPSFDLSQTAQRGTPVHVRAGLRLFGSCRGASARARQAMPRRTSSKVEPLPNRCPEDRWGTGRKCDIIIPCKKTRTRAKLQRHRTTYNVRTRAHREARGRREPKSLGRRVGEQSRALARGSTVSGASAEACTAAAVVEAYRRGASSVAGASYQACPVVA